MKVKILNIIDDKTFKAVSTAFKKHPRYGKYLTTHKNYLVDSKGQKVNVGDEVEIVSSKPVSKNKKWALKVN
ncbi:MAG: 30S ribosomal protein S17 [Rickettsiales bacterium]|nr:30S ribosomal protein S17 [Rickettsiales bacterium]